MWHVKRPNGDVYGPVDVNTLQLWAADGRVAPEDELSEDQAKWIPAPELPDLGMDWLVEFEDGSTYGPVHPLALRDPVRDGSMPPETRVRHKDQEEARALASLLLEQLLALDTQRTAEETDVIERIRGMEMELESLRAQASGSDQEQAAGHTEQNSERVTQLEKELQEWQSRCEAAEQDTRERDALQKDLEQQLEDLKRDAAAASESAAHAPAGAEGYADLVENYDHVLEQIRVKSDELEAARQARTEIQRQAEERIRHVEELLHQEQEEARKAREQSSELEQKHYKLVKSFRELNDRFIRTHRQDPSAETSTS